MMTVETLSTGQCPQSQKEEAVMCRYAVAAVAAVAAAAAAAAAAATMTARRRGTCGAPVGLAVVVDVHGPDRLSRRPGFEGCGGRGPLPATE